MVDNELFAKIKEITEIPAVSGREKLMQQYLKQHLQPYVDEIKQDGLGGIFGIKYSKNPNAKTVLVASHMDEVGFLVSNILPNGMIKVVPLGGWNQAVVSSQRFTLQTDKGSYPIVSSSISPHLLRGSNQANNEVDLTTILFDAGFTSAEEAKMYGVKPGDAIVPVSEAVLTANGQNIICKAWDNRYGCLAVIETVEALANKELDFNLVIGANVQEEVGLRGIQAAMEVFKPDLFFAVDCSAANDIETKVGTFGHLGEGFLLRVHDPRMITLPRMQNYLETLADDKDIKYQYFVSKGGTDAGAAHTMNGGVPSAVIGVCARYIHTHQTIFNIADYKEARAMLQAILLDLNTEKIMTIIYGEED